MSIVGHNTRRIWVISTAFWLVGLGALASAHCAYASTGDVVEADLVLRGGDGC